MSYYSFGGEGDIIIDHGNSNLRTLAGEQKGYLSWASNILTAVFLVGVYGLERGYCLMVGGTDTAVSVCSPIFRALAPGIGAVDRTDPLSRAHLPSMVGYIVDHQALVTL